MHIVKQEKARIISANEHHAQDVKQFVMQFFRMCQARVTTEGHVWRAVLSTHVAKQLAIPQRFHFTFHRQYADENIHLFVPGSAWLDAMIAYARRQGNVSSFIFTGFHMQQKIAALCTVEPWASPHKVPGKALQVIQFSNAHVRHARRRVLYQEELYFHFTVAYISDERTESGYAVFVDPLTERSMSPVDLQTAVFLPLPSLFSSLETDDGATPSYVTQRLYQIACEQLEHLMAPELEKRTKQSRKRLKEEQQRVDTYYRHAAQETMEPMRRQMRQFAAWQMRAWGKQSELQKQSEHTLQHAWQQLHNDYETKLTALEADRKRRLQELEQRYEVEVEIRLTNAACVRVPRIEWTLTLGTQGVNVQFLYDVLRDEVIDFDCSLCNQPLTRVTVCRCENVLCEQCKNSCHDTRS